jgi:hypothetical protein
MYQECFNFLLDFASDSSDDELRKKCLSFVHGNVSDGP